LSYWFLPHVLNNRNKVSFLFIYLLNTDLMAALEIFQGSTSRFCRIEPGVILKYPIEVWKESCAYQKLTDEITNNFSVERQILDLLGEHPRIVKFVYPISVIDLLC
jgi:hypothetical protein